MNPARPTIAFIGPLPPPLHGMAAMNAHIVGLLGEQAEIEAVSVTSDRKLGKWRYHGAKAGRAVKAFAMLVAARRKGARVLYASADDRLGGIWTTGFLGAARMLGYRIFLHHHSYIYVIAKTRVMAAMARVAGPDARHVVLCHEMEDAMARLYPTMRHFLVCPNTVDAPATALSRTPGDVLRVGLLSNLTFEKGLAEFVALIEWAIGQGLPVEGVLAGPIYGAEERAFVKQKTAALGDRLRWLGFIEGEAKERFFQDIGLFVFPTKYRTESFGLVLLEALVRGVPIAAPERGCICVFAPLEAAEVVPLDQDFTPRAQAMIERLAAAPAERARLSDLARDGGAQLNAAHAEAQRALIDAILGAARD